MEYINETSNRNPNKFAPIKSPSRSPEEIVQSEVKWLQAS